MMKNVQGIKTYYTKYKKLMQKQSRQKLSPILDASSHPHEILSSFIFAAAILMHINFKSPLKGYIFYISSKIF